MPVLPAASSSPTPVEGAVRANDTGTTTESTAFSNVLSGQRGTAASPDAKPGAHARAIAALDSKKHDPLGPDEALALILDAAALPLMQAPSSANLTRFSIGYSHADARAIAQTPGRHIAAAAAAAHATTIAQARTDDDATQADAGTRTATPRSAQADALQSQNPVAISAQARDVFDGRQATRPEHGLTDVSARFTAAVSSGRAAATTASTIADIKTNQTLRAGTYFNLENTDLLQADAAQVIHAALTPGVGQQSGNALLMTPQTIPLDVMPMTSATPPAAGSSLPLQISVPTPFNSPQWPQDVSRQLLSLTQAGVGNHTVVMHVNPPELGPVHITLHLGDSLQAAFVSPHANVRQALENALPHLQQQLAQSGLSLGQANVSDQQPGQQQFAQSSDQGSAHTDGAVFSLDGSTDSAASIPAGTAAPTQRIIHPDSLVDTFA
ncbi:flagellar hook-length control protein FliK [Castellaniella sp.]|uniref:flagellar hook-length control protein FliK n=1 Tax=Castellaniella sp. TaxID=1955812 RepID=UPI002AFFA3B4|nr:flagellar hook-length control protein FliK [Castellaniella sp.]